MDAERFDDLTRRLATAASRRRLLKGMAAGLVAGALGGRGGPAAAQDVCTLKANGERCAGGGECCSGRCVRKRGTNKKFCRRAPGQGICTVANDICVSGTPHCNAAGSATTCLCYVTSRGWSFCGADFDLPEDCFACANDADCEERDGGLPGDRCVRCLDNCPLTGDRACARPCPDRA